MNLKKYLPYITKVDDLIRDGYFDEVVEPPIKTINITSTQTEKEQKTYKELDNTINEIVGDI